MDSVYNISGIIYDVDIENIKETFNYLFGYYNVRHKVRLFGEQITYKDSKIEFFGDSKIEKETNFNLFYIDILCHLNLEETLILVRKIEDVFIRNGLIYNFSYEEEDNKGRPLGEEIEFQHPEYLAFMNKHYSS